MSKGIHTITTLTRIAAVRKACLTSSGSCVSYVGDQLPKAGGGRTPQKVPVSHDLTTIAKPHLPDLAGRTRLVVENGLNGRLVFGLQ